ncbi:GIY-YIG nuclease family protein [Nannocystis sp. SCPEA4]|uniref:GIY-YIG nuclease family protein n=1 Tax=Nannocystis sp. SCPEA4 TaxID=2996787 RepID=UPI00226FCF3D|nr:GIY-YIG nuclease family protein [Nannocystis sp. SCPEA4]MCY1058205.1 GIY-YIG nuclease family protein [Nannocystis sp. SCPEA4]
MTSATPTRTRADQKRQYREQPRRAGIYLIRNTVSGKVLLGSTMNLHGPLNRHRFMLGIGGHPNRALQEDWRRLGPDAFEFTIADVVTPQDEEAGPHEDELWLLEQVWIERTSPFGERGYNLHPRIRDA